MGKEKKDKILDEALVSFVENGYKGTNLRDFAAGMGLSKSGFSFHNVFNRSQKTSILSGFFIFSS